MKLKSIIICMFLVFISNSCDGQRNKSKEIESNKTSSMKTDKTPKYEKMIADLSQSMLDYREISNPSYSKNDVAECSRILNNYLSEISNSKSKEEGMEYVKNAVEKLNKLNEKCDFQLIETSEREQIAEIIILASSEKGYNQPDEDITEEWREW